MNEYVIITDSSADLSDRMVKELGVEVLPLAFNMGNALGAFCGGLPIAAGLPPRYAALVGVPFIVLGLVSFIIFCRKYERKA